MIIFLIGYMGAGKSIVGREVGRATGFRFVDMDKEVEVGEKMPISEIFSKYGEEYFRKSERAVLELLVEECEYEDIVVATGGGVPCFGDNMDLMNAVGVTIYLKISPEGLVKRLMWSRDKRPIIRGMNDAQLLAFIESNLKQRAHYYEAAQATIDCDVVSDKQVCRRVADVIGSEEMVKVRGAGVRVSRDIDD